MAWPFSEPIAPSFDSDAMEVPIVEADIPNQTGVLVYLVCARFTNPTAGAISVVVKDSNSNQLIASAEVSPNGSPVVIEVPFEPLDGPLTWVATGAGLIGHLWGWQ